MKKRLYIALLAIVLPLLAYADTGSSLVGCSQTGAYSSSVGSFSATNGVYVPVSDAAVELNTGYLVQYECTLKGVIGTLSTNSTAKVVAGITTAIATGRDGNPQFSVNLPQEENTTGYTAAANTTVNGLDSLDSKFKGAVQRVVARQVQADYNSTGANLGCTRSTSDNYLDKLSDLKNPNCSAIYAAVNAKTYVDSVAQSSVNNMLTQLQWGQGFYPKGSTDANGNIITQTPGAVMLYTLNTALNSGFNKTANASDLGQMVGSLFDQLGAQAITGQNGLTGLTQSSSGSSSYINQISSEASSGAISSIVNLALQNLSTAKQQEETYGAALNSLAGTLTQAVLQLRSAESQCWNKVIQYACTGTTTISGGQETCPANGTTLVIATSSTYAFAQKVIDAQIAPLVTSADIDTNSTQSAATLDTITSLMTTVSKTTTQNSSSFPTQKISSVLSTAQQDYTRAQNLAMQQTTLSQEMRNLVTDTVQTWVGTDSNGSNTISWDGTVSPGAGWCNYPNTATISAWRNAWKK